MLRRHPWERIMKKVKIINYAGLDSASFILAPNSGSRFESVRQNKMWSWIKHPKKKLKTKVMINTYPQTNIRLSPQLEQTTKKKS